MVVTSSSPSEWLSSKKRLIEVVMFHCARFRGISATSFVRGSSRVCVGLRSAAALKSRSSRLRKSLSVLGAEGVSDVRMMIEYSLHEPAKGTCMRSCSSASLLRMGWSLRRSSQLFFTIPAPDRGSSSFSVLIASKFICLYRLDCRAGSRSWE